MVGKGTQSKNRLAFAAAIPLLGEAGIRAAPEFRSWTFDLVHDDRGQPENPVWKWPPYVVDRLGGLAMVHPREPQLKLAAMILPPPSFEDNKDFTAFYAQLNKIMGGFDNLRTERGFRDDNRGSVMAYRNVDMRGLESADIVREVVRFGSDITAPDGVRRAMSGLADTYDLALLPAVPPRTGEMLPDEVSIPDLYLVQQTQ